MHIVILVAVVLLTVLAVIEQVRHKEFPYGLCMFSSLLSILSWPFWIYYTSANIRTQSIISKIGIPMTSEGCHQFSAYFSLSAGFTAFAGTLFIVWHLIRVKPKEKYLIVRSIVWAILAWGILITVPGLSRI